MRLLAAFAALVLVLPGHAAAVMINNGLAPPNPENVIDYSTDNVYVRNAGCPPGWPGSNPDDPCPSPGDPTTVALTELGYVSNNFEVFDTSVATITDSFVDDLYLYNSATVTMTDSTLIWLDLYDFATLNIIRPSGFGFFGIQAYDFSTLEISDGFVEHLDAYGFSNVTLTNACPIGLLTFDTSTVTVSSDHGGGDWLDVYDSSTVTTDGCDWETLLVYNYANVTMLSGGFDIVASADDSSTFTLVGATLNPGAWLSARGTSELFVVGSGFEVDWVPVPYGGVTPLIGTLTGTLASGDAINNPFGRGSGASIVLVPGPTNAACDDAQDNDGDGFVDYLEDSNCTDALDLSERPDCQDGIDNDGDGDIDLHNDSGCTDYRDESEHPQCSDGIENEFDGLIDYPDDPDCASPLGVTEAPPFNIVCGLGVELALLLPPLMWLWRRRRW